MKQLKLSIVDQSPAYGGLDHVKGLANTLRLAKMADDHGYHRYWMAEHHATPSYSCSAPEIVIGQIAVNTKCIRVGTGGVMLSHYSPYKVAEAFKTLSAFHPNRVDLGIGRAPGGSALPSQALSFPYSPVPADVYPDLVHLLTQFLTGEGEKNQFSDLTVTPVQAAPIERWMLGSSDGSIDLAAHYGWGFVLALFIGTHERPASIISDFRNLYTQKHGATSAPPPAMISSAVICADSAEEAKLLASSHTFWKLQSQMRGVREGLRPAEECMDLYKTLSPSEKSFFDVTRDSMITGTPEQCLDQLYDQAKYYDVEEVMAVAVTYDFEKRLESYRMLALEAGMALSRVGRSAAN